MFDLEYLMSEYITIDYSENQQPLYCYINKVHDNNLYLIPSRNFVKSGILYQDNLKCTISTDDSEYYFSCAVKNMQKIQGKLHLVVTPVTEIERYFNLREHKRYRYQFIAFTDNNILSTVKNFSKAGLCITTTDEFKQGDTIILSLVINYPTTDFVISGEIVRKTKHDDKYEYGIKILKFTSEGAKQDYLKFVDNIKERLLSI